MNKKAASGNIWLIIGVIAIVALVANQLGYLPGKQSAAPGTTTTTTSGGQVIVAPVETINPTDTITLTITAKDDGNKSVVTTYRAVNALAVVNGVEFKTSQIAASSTGGTITGIPVNSNVQLILYNDTNVYTKQYNGNILAKASMPVSDYVMPFSTPQIQIRNMTSGYGLSALARTAFFNMTLTAGGASEQFDIYAKASSSYTKFGDEAIYVACTGVSADKYIVTTDMTPISLTNGMSGVDKKLAWQSNVKSIGTSLTKIASMEFGLKGGQTAANINCTVYDKAKFLSIDGITLKSNVEKDDTATTDVGAGNGFFMLEAGP